ncbi:quinon protein alcohol dehydrogenase-like superfamily [Lipomyces arxii]|uniref:quinon protein alcohol dehydrogenase-like superfamily n=1 Tax=Lipomyces arxii TaxID=56418 RepID=UPI0034CF8B92
MSMTRESIWAALPSTAKGVTLHYSYDARTDRLVYPSNKSIYLRSLSKPSESTQFTGHIAPTTVAKFAPSGYYIASGDAAGLVKVFDSSSTTSDPEIVKGDFNIISGKINDLSWDSDSKRIIAVGEGKERYGHCFTFDAGNSVGEIAGHSTPINSVDIRSVRPFRAATVADDSSMVWFTGPPYKFAKAVRGEHSNFATDVKFALDGSYAVSVGMDRKIVVYDGREGDALAKVDSAHGGGILAVAVGKTESGNPIFATASTDSKAKLWEFKEGHVLEIHTWDVATGQHLVGITFTSPTTLTAVSLAGDIYYLSTSATEPTSVIYGHQKAITALQVSSDKKKIYTGSYDGRVVQWNISTGESTLVTGDAHSNFVTGIIECAGKIYTAAWDDTIKAVSGSEFLSPFLSTPSQPKGFTAVGTYLILATEDSVISYTTDFKVVSSAKVLSITAIAGSESILAVGAQNGTITLMSVPDLKPLATKISPLRAAVSVLSFSPVKEERKWLLAAGDSTGKIAVVNAVDGSVVTTRWAFHTARVQSIAWRADGKYAATGGLDTNVFVYSVDRPARNIKTTGAHKDGVSAVAWSEDNKLVTVGADACIKWWKVELTA